MLQKPFLTSPCCMGSVFFGAFHAAWGREQCFLQHLCSENATFSVCYTNPQRGGRKSRNPVFQKARNPKMCVWLLWRTTFRVDTHAGHPADRAERSKQQNSKTTTTTTTTTTTLINKFCFRTSRGIKAHRGNCLGPWAFSRGRCLLHLQVFSPKANGCISCGAIM